MVPRACLRDRNLHWHLQSEKRKSKQTCFSVGCTLFSSWSYHISFLFLESLDHQRSSNNLHQPTTFNSQSSQSSFSQSASHHRKHRFIHRFFKFIDTDEYKVILIGLGQSQTNIWSSGLTLTDPYIRRWSYVIDEYMWHIFIGDVASSVMTLLYSSVNRWI
jgi:hypothetical protein